MNDKVHTLKPTQMIEIHAALSNDAGYLPDMKSLLHGGEGVLVPQEYL